MLCRLVFLLSLLALALSAHSQTFTTVSGTTVQDGYGNLLPTGVACFSPLNSAGALTAITPSGGSPTTGPFCANITNGAFSVAGVVPNLLTSTPTGITYGLTVTNAGFSTVLGVNGAVINGASWSFDTFQIPVPIYTGQPSAFGLGAPYKTCATPALFTRTDAPAPSQSGWTCTLNGGYAIWVQTGSGPLPPSGGNATLAQVAAMIAAALQNVVVSLNNVPGAWTLAGSGVSINFGTKTATFSGSGSGGATLPTNALVYGLSSTTSRAATASDVGALGTLSNSTTGSAATAGAFSSTPGLCSTGFAPTGILANGNATGCAAIGGSGGITGLTGDGTASGTGSVAFTLATVNSGPGTCGDATHVCQVTTNGKGLTTGQAAVAIAGGSSPLGSGTVNTTNGQLAADTLGGPSIAYGMDIFGASFEFNGGSTPLLQSQNSWPHQLYMQLVYPAGQAAAAPNPYEGNLYFNDGGAGNTAGDVSYSVFHDAPLIQIARNPLMIDGGSEFLNDAIRLPALGQTVPLYVSEQFRWAGITRLATVSVAPTSISGTDFVSATGSNCTTTGSPSTDTTFTLTPGLTLSGAGSITCNMMVGTSGTFTAWVKATNSVAGTYNISIDGGSPLVETFSGIATQSAENTGFGNGSVGVLGNRYTATQGFHTVTFTRLSGTVTLIGFALPPNMRNRQANGPAVYVGGTSPVVIPITGITITSNVATFSTGTTFYSPVGDTMICGGFTQSVFLNNLTIAVSGQGSNTITAPVTHANYTGTDGGACVDQSTTDGTLNAAAISLTQQAVADGYSASFLDIRASIRDYTDFSVSATIDGCPASTAGMHPGTCWATRFAGTVFADIGAQPVNHNQNLATLSVVGNTVIGYASGAQANLTRFYDGNGDAGYLGIQAISGNTNISIFGSGITGVNVGGNTTWNWSGGSALNRNGGGQDIGAVQIHGVVGMASGNLEAVCTATSIANCNSQPLSFTGSYWTGSASNAHTSTFSTVCGTGTNPACNLTFTRTGSANAADSVDFSAAGQFKLPVAVSYAPLANGEVGYDSVDGWKLWQSGAANFIASFPVASPPTSGHCASFLLTGSIWTMADAGTCGGTATNLSGGAVGSVPYQSAANTTAFLASPTTNGHTFVPSWQPTGSAIAPVALDLATYLLGPPPIGSVSATNSIFGSVITATTAFDQGALGTATSGGNFNSGPYEADSSYWTGSAAATDRWLMTNVLGTGANPTSTLTFAHSGSSGAAAVLFPLIQVPTIQGVSSGNGSITLNCGAGTTAAVNFCLLQPSTANVGGFFDVTYGKGGGATGDIGQTVGTLNCQPGATNSYCNPVYRAAFNYSNTHVQTVLELGPEGGMDSAGNLIAVAGTSYGTHHIYAFDNLNSLTWLSYQPDFTITPATTNGTITVAYTGSQAGMAVGQKLVPNTVMGIPASTTIATLTPGTGFTMSNAATQSATGNVYVISPLLSFAQKTQATGGFSVATLSTTSNCNSTAASPVPCSAAASGQVQIPAAATTITINTTAVQSANTRVGCLVYSTIGITAPTNVASLIQPYLSGIVSGTSITLTIPVAPLTNPVNLQYCLIN